MEYLLKASLVIALFYICYKIFLQRETFFESNRWYLLSGLLAAFTLPFVVIPIYITQTAIEIPNAIFTTISSESNVETLSFLETISIIYLIGVLFFTVRFILQISSLFKLFINTEKRKEGNYIFVQTDNNISPFSFFKWIIYNANQFKEAELTQILTHEKVHVNQLHSIDVIISQIAAIAFWFNPFIWQYKKDLQQNLEFIADYNTQNKVDCKKSYQYLLLKSSVPNNQLALTNNFYNSLIKKRIVMLHKSKSKRTNQFKYLVIIPFLAIFLMSFNTKEIIVENKLESINNTQEQTFLRIDQMVIITKDFTDTDFEKVKKKLKKEGLTVKFKGVKRNNNGEITAIKIDIDSKQSNANYNVNGDAPINTIKISYDNEGGNISIGNSNNFHFEDTEYSFSTKDDKQKIHVNNEDVKVNITKSHNNQKVYVITSEDEVIDINTVMELDNEVDEDILIEISPDNKEDKDSFKVRTSKKGNKVLFSGNNDVDPIIYVNDKEVSKEEMDKLNSDNIATIEVLKGESASEKYGEKGDNGVILITTK